MPKARSAAERERERERERETKIGWGGRLEMGRGGAKGNKCCKDKEEEEEAILWPKM